MPNQSTACKHESCSRPANGGKRYCTRHYAEWKRGKLPKARYKTCRAEGCRKPMEVRGRCTEHAKRDFPGQRKADSAPAAAGGEAPAETNAD